MSSYRSLSNYSESVERKHSAIKQSVNSLKQEKIEYLKSMNQLTKSVKDVANARNISLKQMLS